MQCLHFWPQGGHIREEHAGVRRAVGVEGVSGHALRIEPHKAHGRQPLRLKRVAEVHALGFQKPRNRVPRRSVENAVKNDAALPNRLITIATLSG